MTTTRPDPTPAELLAAARALLAQAEAMMREPAEAAPTPSKPEPVGTWGGHTDWIAWSGGACPVGAEVVVDYVMRTENKANAHIDRHQAGMLRWNHYEPPHPMAQNDIIAYRLVTPAAPPVQEPEPKPAGVVLRGWEQDQRHPYVWNLLRPDGRLVAWTNSNGWSTDNTTGPETGLLGKAAAVERLLTDGATWESDARWSASLDHIPETVREFRPGDVAVMTDGTRRTVEETTRTRILFADGSWMTTEAAETAVAARVLAADVPF